MPIFSGDTTAFLFQPGGGVDFKATKSVQIRLQGDYQYTTKGEFDGGKFRFIVAAVVGFGPR